VVQDWERASVQNTGKGEDRIKIKVLKIGGHLAKGLWSDFSCHYSL